MPRFDSTINLGHVLTIVTLLGTLAIAYSTYKVTISSLDSRLAYLETYRVTNLEANDKTRASQLVDMSNALYSIKSDVAIIRDRIEREKK
jgi:hypothetical protein